MRGRRIAALILIAVIGPVLPACTVAPGGRTGVYQCADWADFSDPALAFESADAVVVGTPAASTSTVPMMGVDAAVHEVAVRVVLKGEVEDGGTIEVASTPETCSDGGLYPSGDPLDTDAELLLYLTTPSTFGIRATLTPGEDTVRPAPPEDTLVSDAGGA
ncbi:hypothetical protein [Brachybacterium hainanense]|uniref:Lipoprotein n=1 Tax=Brachybacterium hainanense TaxID=1541174 RepID=A0ABV6REC1_9MICO